MSGEGGQPTAGVTLPQVTAGAEFHGESWEQNYPGQGKMELGQRPHARHSVGTSRSSAPTLMKIVAGVALGCTGGLAEAMAGGEHI